MESNDAPIQPSIYTMLQYLADTVVETTAIEMLYDHLVSMGYTPGFINEKMDFDAVVFEKLGYTVVTASYWQ